MAKMFSEDGAWWWDGEQWRAAFSEDGLWRWTGSEWEPVRSATPPQTAKPMLPRLRLPFGPRSDEQQAEHQQRQLVKAAEKQVRQAEDSRTRAMKDATKALQGAARDHEQAIRQAEHNLQAWTYPGDGHRIGSYQSVTLYEHVVATPQGRGPTLRAHATVDTAGNLEVTRRATLTRLVLLGGFGALLFKKRVKHDARELYLLVETSQTVAAVQCPPDEGLKARQFAAQINTQAIREADWMQQREMAIPQWQQRLLYLQADTSAVDAARAELTRIEGSPALRAAVSAAEQELQRVRSLDAQSDPGGRKALEEGRSTE